MVCFWLFSIGFYSRKKYMLQTDVTQVKNIRVILLQDIWNSRKFRLSSCFPFLALEDGNRSNFGNGVLVHGILDFAGTAGRD